MEARLGGEVGGVEVVGMVDSSVLERGPGLSRSKSKSRPESETSEMPMEVFVGSSRERLIEFRYRSAECIVSLDRDSEKISGVSKDAAELPPQ